MVTAATDEARANYASEIIERILPAIDQEYDEVRAHEMPDINMRKKIRAIDARISILRKKIDSEKGHRKSELEVQLQIKLAQRQAIKNEINEVS